MATILVNCLANSALAQVEGIIAGDARGSLIAPDSVDNSKEPKILDECYPSRPWSVDALIGLPTGIRFQRFFNSEKGYGWMGETFIGLEVILPTLGAGIRYGMNPWLGKNDAISFNPGVDYYWVMYPFFDDRSSYVASIHMITFDTDIVWKHAYSNRFSGELGLKIGFGVPFAKGLGPVPILIPVVSGFVGFRF